MASSGGTTATPRDLTAGGHSNGYFNGTLVIEDPALCDEPMTTWSPEDCKVKGLCNIGSKAVKPKGNWSKLTANY